MSISQKDQKVFNDWLSLYQEDFVKIVGKFRRNSHPLSLEEIISEINHGFIKSSEKLINQEDTILKDHTTFKKVAYAFARNHIAWTSDGVSKKDKNYLSKRSDTMVKTNEGEDKTLFEYVCETIGDQDESFKKLEESDKFQNILKWIFDYSHFLTDHQKNVLELVLSGKSQEDIGEFLGVTHQAISAITIELFQKIKNHIKVDVNNGNSDAKIIKDGHSSVKNLYGDNRIKSRRVDPKKLDKIKKLIHLKPKTYTFDDLSQKVGKSISPQQIAAWINSQKFNNLIKKKCEIA